MSLENKSAKEIIDPIVADETLRYAIEEAGYVLNEILSYRRSIEKQRMSAMCSAPADIRPLFTQFFQFLLIRDLYRSA